jgi:hypothetical protein
MGVLEKMVAGDIASRLPQKTAGEISKAEISLPTPPNARCEKCGSVQFWLDAYKNWNCGGCTPPRVPALMREVRTIDPTAESAERIMVDGQEWIRRQDCQGRWGWERADLPEKNRWWARWDFEDLPLGEFLFCKKPDQKPVLQKGGATISTPRRG